MLLWRYQDCAAIATAEHLYPWQNSVEAASLMPQFFLAHPTPLLTAALLVKHVPAPQHFPSYAPPASL